MSGGADETHATWGIGLGIGGDIGWAGTSDGALEQIKNTDARIGIIPGASAPINAGIALGDAFINGSYDFLHGTLSVPLDVGFYIPLGEICKIPVDATTTLVP